MEFESIFCKPEILLAQQGVTATYDMTNIVCKWAKLVFTDSVLVENHVFAAVVVVQSNNVPIEHALNENSPVKR